MTDFPGFFLDTNTHVATVASLTDWRAYVRTFADAHMPPMSPSEARSFLLRTCRMVSLSNPGRNTDPPTAGTRIEHSGQLLVEWAAERGVDLAAGDAP